MRDAADGTRQCERVNRLAEVRAEAILGRALLVVVHVEARHGPLLLRCDGPSLNVAVSLGRAIETFYCRVLLALMYASAAARRSSA